MNGMENWALKELKEAGVFSQDFEPRSEQNFTNFLITQGVRALKVFSAANDEEEPDVEDGYLMIAYNLQTSADRFERGVDWYPNPVIRPKTKAAARKSTAGKRPREPEIIEPQQKEAVLEKAIRLADELEAVRSQIDKFVQENKE